MPAWTHVDDGMPPDGELVLVQVEAGGMSEKDWIEQVEKPADRLAYLLTGCLVLAIAAPALLSLWIRGAF